MVTSGKGPSLPGIRMRHGGRLPLGADLINGMAPSFERGLQVGLVARGVDQLAQEHWWKHRKQRGETACAAWQCGKPKVHPP